MLAAVSAALIVPTAACSGSGSDKAGGSRHAEQKPKKPLTLTLLSGDALYAPEYADTVQRLSHGSMRIQINVAGNQPDYERGTVRLVRSGHEQLGAVGARVWDTLGVTTFRALVAPFLVDSLELEQRVLESPRISRMLDGVNRAGVVGLAVLPGPLRRPLGLRRPLAGPEDYRGAAIAIRFGGVARATFAALGATTKGYNIGVLPSSADGAELDLNTVAENGFDAGARTITSNVVFWPRPQTIFANRQVYDRLTAAQRQILRRAGREALAPEIARIVRDDKQALSEICARNAVSLAGASTAQLAALRRAVRPVVDDLERDQFTKVAIAEITTLRRGHPTDVVRCSSVSRTAAASRLEGRWHVAASSDDLLAVGTPPGEAERQRGDETLELRGGRWTFAERHSGFVWRGRYAVHGDLLDLTVVRCQATRDVCTRGATASFRWSVYRDRLSLERASGVAPYYGLLAKPFTRVR
jgi:TRAP-type C4-dicarboxylate transport system substrate-binding protein